MGTKRALAPAIADAAATGQPGIFLDVFAGTCSVVQAIMPKRSVWTNDVQHFACNMAHLIVSDDLAGLDTDSIIACLESKYLVHADRLRRVYREAVDAEQRSLASDSIPDFAARIVTRPALALNVPSREYQLFSGQYANSYLGLAQCIEVDALRYSIDLAFPSSPHFEAKRRLALFALGSAILKCSATTGHFAQFMKPSASNWKRYKRYRNSLIWPSFKDALVSALETKLTGKSRANKVHRSDCVALLESLLESSQRPSVIYADPPYKQDQYSRFYHLLETMILYDYPETTGKGRYRTDRFTSQFSLRSKARGALSQLAWLSREMSSDLILSYPNQNLLALDRDGLISLLRGYFRKVEVVHETSLHHSTMGGSKGQSKQVVCEQVFMGQN